jgi:formate dehydrogenase major subunit
VRKVMPPMAGLADWEVTVKLSNALGYPMHYAHPREIMAEIASLTPTFRGVTYEKIDKFGSVQWPCNEDTAEAGTETMHIGEFVRGKGRFIITQYVASEEKVTRKFPLILTTGRILSQYNVGAQTRRTENVQWHSEDLLEIHPHDAQERGIKEGDWVGIHSRAGDTVLRAQVTERMQPGVVYTTFHFPESGANVITTDSSDWATNCPEYKVTAVQVMPVAQPSEWQKSYSRFNDEQLRLLKSAGSPRPELEISAAK